MKLAAIASASMISVVFALAPAKAAYLLRLAEVNGSVVATGSGSVSLAKMQFSRPSGGRAELVGALALATVGDTDNASTFPAYAGVNGPTSFGTWLFNSSSGGLGPVVGINGFSGELFVPWDYISGSPLGISTATFNGTFASLGIEEGIYRYRLGYWGGDDTFTVIIGPASGAPEPLSWAMMLGGFGFIGAAMRYRRHQSISFT